MQKFWVNYDPLRKQGVEEVSCVRFISDLHLGHKKICDFEGPNRGDTKSVEEHDAWIIQRWNSVVKKQDIVWVLGDVAFTREGLAKVKLLNGTKHLIIGNHDEFPLREYLSVFNKVHGFMRYKGHWLSHAPIHPNSLRGKKNIHGHMHSKPLDDVRYRCVSVELLKGVPKTLEELFL